MPRAVNPATAGVRFGGEVARGGGERIVLADDNADMRDYVRRLLVAGGYRVEAVADGEAALTAASREGTDLILTDVMMPRLDGFGLLKRLRERADLKILPVILLSARAGEDAFVEGLDAGADDYVSKPFSARELLVRVKTNLHLASMRREAEDALREQAARLDTVINTVPTAVWFTHDPGARRIVGNDYAAQLLRRAPGSNASLSAGDSERPRFRISRNGTEIHSKELPLQRAARGEDVKDEELEVVFDGGSSISLICYAAPIRNVSGGIDGAVCGAIEITERKRHEAHREMLLNELNHRVKNTLTTVQSFAMQTLRTATSAEEGRKAFEARLIALARAHDLLVREKWEGADLHDVLSEALTPYAGNEGHSARFQIEGPAILLQPKAALAISMAIHELATNAVKYGALSNGEGLVRLRWEVSDGAPEVRLKWQEIGGPPVIAPSRRGFGTRLIEKGLAQDLGGSVRLEYPAEGATCTIVAPVNELPSLA